MQWTGADDAELRRLRSRELTWAQCGAAMGRTSPACATRGLRIGLSVTGPRFWTAERIALVDRMRDQGATCALIGAAIGRSAQCVRQFRTRSGRAAHVPRGRPWGADEERELLRLYSQQGECYATIAAQLGRSVDAVKQKMWRRYLERLGTVTEPAPADPDWSFRQLRSELKAGNGD